MDFLFTCFQVDQLHCFVVFVFLEDQGFSYLICFCETHDSSGSRLFRSLDSESHGVESVVT